MPLVQPPSNDPHLWTKAASLILILLALISLTTFGTCTSEAQAQETIEGVPCEICVSEAYVRGQRDALDEARAEAREERREQARLQGRVELYDALLEAERAHNAELIDRTAKLETQVKVGWGVAGLSVVAGLVAVFLVR